MTDPTVASTTVKQDPTPATYGRVATVAGSTILGPQVVEPLISYGFDIIHAFAPTFPPPSEGVLWSLATVLCGLAATWASYSLRGTRQSARSTDAPQQQGI